MALARRGRTAAGGPDVWEVDRSGLLVQHREGGGWEVKLYVRLGFHYGRDEYARRHALLDKRFLSRARAVDAVRMAALWKPSALPQGSDVTPELSRG